MILNRDRLIKILEKKNLDAVIASTPVNIQYLTDIAGAAGFAVISREKNIEPFFITGIANNDRVVDSGTWIKDIRFRGGAYYWEYDPTQKLTDLEKKMKTNYDSAVMDQIVHSPWTHCTPAMREELGKGLQERGFDGCKLGIEEAGTTITEFKKLKKALPKSKLILADDTFNYARQVKTADELKLFEESVPIVDEGWKAICESAKVGITEGELLKAYRKSVVSYGLEGCGVLYNFHLAIGRRTVMSFSGSGMNRSAKLEKGDLITFNGGVIYKNHQTHHSRTAVLGEPKHPKVNAYYKAILEAEDAGLEALRPGVKASEIYSVMVNTAKKTIPYYRRHHTGHALGMGGYDTPNFIADDHTPLEEGMVFNIEPSAFQEFGFGAIRLEDTLAITKKGYKLFTTTSRDIWRLKY